jgi:hypothetical protein
MCRYDASLSFIAVYYALCSGSSRRLLHASAAAAAATLVHVAVGVTMGRAGLPAGTLGFVFATMVVVCCIRGTESGEGGGGGANAALSLAISANPDILLPSALHAPPPPSSIHPSPPPPRLLVPDPIHATTQSPLSPNSPRSSSSS